MNDNNQNNQHLSDCLETLNNTIINDSQTVSFTFISKFNQNSELWSSEDYKNDGTVIIEDLINHKKYKSRYKLEEINDRVVLEIKFDEFKLTFNSPFMKGEQGSFIGNFGDVYDQIKKFPSFSR